MLTPCCENWKRQSRIRFPRTALNRVRGVPRPTVEPISITRRFFAARAGAGSPSHLFTLHTSHFTLHTSHFTLHTSHFTLHTSLFSLLTSLFSLLSSHFSLLTSLVGLGVPRPTLRKLTCPTTYGSQRSWRKRGRSPVQSAPTMRVVSPDFKDNLSAMMNSLTVVQSSSGRSTAS